MKTNILTHLVPTLPPKTGQAGQYALDLARQLRDRCGISSQFILCDSEWNGPARIEDFVVRRLRFPNDARLWAMLASLKDDSSVLLHYSGHSYQKNGLPNWLYLGIKFWLADHDGGSVKTHKQFLTVFHDLGGPTTKPWQKEFYLQLLQKRLVERLHRQSEVSITNTHRDQAQLNAIEPRKTLLLPKPANLPIIDQNKPKGRRNMPLLVAIILGHELRCETIRAHANLLSALDKGNRLSGVMLLGGADEAGRPFDEEFSLLQKSVAPTRIKVFGNQTPENISLALNRADLFLSPQGGESACKSGSVMAALAMGCATVLRDGRNAVPLQEGTHFIASDDSPSSVKRFERMAAAGELERVATAGHTWYQRFADWNIIARKYQQALQERVPVAPTQKLDLDLALLSLPAATR